MMNHATIQPQPAEPSRLRRVREVAAVFLKIGITGFGGPAALIALTQDEVVQRRKWLTRERFGDIVGITNLIPGPNATEIAIMVGYLYAGWLGLLTAGVCVVLPAAIISGALGWMYVQWGALPAIAPLFLGIKPVVVTIVLAAVWRLGGTVTRDWRLVAIAIVTALASLARGNEIAALLLGGVLGALWLHLSRTLPGVKGRMAAILFGVAASSWVATKTALAAAGSVAEQIRHVPLWELGLFFLKIGSVLYGSGYVLIAFLEGGLVRDLGWLTSQQLLDAIAVGQFTPGPLLSTASFIGYLLGGAPGVAVATLGVFGPSFIFVALVAPWLPRLRRSYVASLFLDAVGAASIGLMAAVGMQLGQQALTSIPAWLIALAAAWAGLRMKVNFAWLVVGGAVVGWAMWALGISL
jgi:chromate transporter